MRLTTATRLWRDKYYGARLRQKYWEIRNCATEVLRLFDTSNREFLQHVLLDSWHYMIAKFYYEEDRSFTRIQSAVNWLLRAQRETADDGVSLGYFPCRGGSEKWLSSYPETTGYIITTLLAYSERFKDVNVRDAALRMAHWEIAIQMPSGAVQGGPACSPEQQAPAAFNTGMVLDGWCSAYSITGEKIFLDAARRAADFLQADIDEMGFFRTNGRFVSTDEIKTYTCLCAWAMHRFGELSGEALYQQSAIRVIEAAIGQQQPNGWFAHNCLTRSIAPLTHTIGYTLQGILEVGIRAQRPDFIAAVKAGVNPLISCIDHRGLLAGRYYADWKPAVLSSCLTGNAQIAIVCFRLYEVSGLMEYKQAADTLVNTLKALQVIKLPHAPFNGAIAGSFPIFGGYMRGGYPNWATKYFIDALLLQDRFSK